jgi:hypothetical protein
MILSLTGQLLPQYQEKVFTYSQPALFGELVLTLWLVYQGRQAASAGGDRLIVGGWLGCTTGV